MNTLNKDLIFWDVTLVLEGANVFIFRVNQSNKGVLGLLTTEDEYEALHSPGSLVPSYLST
jgi:hypothetical protein